MYEIKRPTRDLQRVTQSADLCSSLQQRATLHRADAFRTRKGPFLATKHFFPALIKSDNAKIIDISSGSASISSESEQNLNSHVFRKST